jgi:Ca2+-binding RTX toxin-like protein
VTGDGYNFSFKGMSQVEGTPFNDVFVPGTGSVTLNGEGGNDWLNYANAPTAAYINLSTTQYTIPSGTNAGTVVPAGTALGGFGGLTCGLPTSTGCITVNDIPNVVDTARGNDVVVGGPGAGRMLGGSNGNDTFLPTGGDDVINGGTGANNTIDLSLLPDPTTLDLWSSARQVLGPQSGSITLVPGTIETAIASPAGSTLEAGNGNNVTLIGGAGNDTLVAGVGNQTINGKGGSDVLVAGIGSDTLIGGNQPVTFMPGQGGTDTLVSPAASNTLSYGNVPVSTPWKRPPLIGPVGALVNLSNQSYSVPPGKPFAGTSLTQQTATGGWGATVLLSGVNITTVTGSPAPDILITGSNDIVSGGGGNDLFVVSGGGNTLTAAPGTASTFLFNTSSGNVISGGGSATIDFSQVTSCSTSPCLNVNLRSIPNGTARIGPAGTETLLPVPGTENSAHPTPGILNVVGTNFNDVLVAGAANATITGLNGNDVLVASPSGHDTLQSGGGGDDVFCASAPGPCDGFTSGAGNTIIGGTGNQTICTQNGGADNVNGGVGGFNFAVADAVDTVTNVQTVVRTPNTAC